MAEKCVVNSLSEYIAAIEKYGLFNCISRGEHKKYDYPLRSGVHRKHFEQYSKLLDAYHLDVETTINPIQDKHFIAFAQHHGIPTNLLDFSCSPLVSLYFSVSGSEEKGYVYFIKKERTVSVNNSIIEKPRGWGMLSDLLDYDPLLFREILPQMAEAFMANREEMIEYFENHADTFIREFKKHRAKSYLETLEGGVDDFEKALMKYRSYKPEWKADTKVQDPVTLQIYDSAPSFLNSLNKVYKGDIHHPSSFFANYCNVSDTVVPRHCANIHVMMFLFKMEEIEYCYESAVFSKQLEHELEFPFYFTYHPPVIDERVKNQSSIFIVQPFSTGKMLVDGEWVKIWQKIIPDFTIEIQNPTGIKQELDSIGINLKHIYCDYDSIAKYTVNAL